MDAQHSYEISLKKDALFINLSSDDVYFISKQMDKWFRILLDDSYVPVTLPQRPQPASVEPPVALPPPQPADEQPAAPQPEPIPQPVATVPIAAPELSIPQAAPPAEPIPAALPMEEPAPQPVYEQPVPPPQPEPMPQVTEAPVAAPVMVEEAVPPVVQPQPAMVDLPPIMQPAAPVAAPQPALSVVSPAPQPALVTAAVGTQPLPEDDFEAVMNTVMQDLETPKPLPQPLQNTGNLHIPAPLPPREPADLSLVSSLSDLCEQAHAGTSEDYLILASYYLNQMEYQETFSLKRINSNLVKSGLTPVNHSILETVLSKGLLAMVPDMTGTAEASEYMITQEGLNAVNALF